MVQDLRGDSRFILRFAYKNLIIWELCARIQGMIDRYLTDQLKKAISKRPAIALLGVRQVGKTTLANLISQDYDSLYLDLESPEDLTKLQSPLEFLKSHQDKLVIIDEIQRQPDLFMVLRGLIDEARRQGKTAGQYLLLGSASMDLLRQSSESLAGRISYLELHGLNLLEVNPDAENKTKLWFRGGFPDSYLETSDEESMNWLEDLIRTYLERDMPQLGFRVPAIKLRRFWTMLAHLQGETINYSKLASNLDDDQKKVKYYLDILVDMLLINRLEPWHENTKKRLIKSPRIYVRDSGILHRLLGIQNRDGLFSNPILGKSWEGFVIQNILSILPKTAEAYFYRTTAGAELDLVIKLGAETIGIEIKYGLSPKNSKGFHRSCAEVKATQKYIVYSGDDEFPIGGSAAVISLEKIMRKLTPTE